MTKKSDKLREFIIQHLDDFEISGGGGTRTNLPEFELYALDYLSFAEKELISYQSDLPEQQKRIHIINCVSHLKRAMDCQLDTFLHVYNLYRTFSSKNLKFEKKLEFLNAAGISSPRSLARLNSIRNKMEHNYEIPQISDIEVYYDLTQAFIAVLQSLVMFAQNSELEIIIYGTNSDKEIGVLTIRYALNTPSITASWRLESVNESLTCSIDEPTEFAFFFKVLYLLYQYNSFASNEYIASQISS